MKWGYLKLITINPMYKFAPLLYWYMLDPTCFGSSLPSWGSFWIRLSYVKIQIDMMVYLKYITDKNQCVKHLVWNKTDWMTVTPGRTRVKLVSLVYSIASASQRMWRPFCYSRVLRRCSVAREWSECVCVCARAR
jgi:hypothetical protein